MDYLAPVRSHLDGMLAHAPARVSKDPTAMWWSALDLRTRTYPEPDTHAPDIEKRVYRNIDAPRGCSLYWDLPQLAAAHTASALTGRNEYALAADAYVRDFLRRCVAQNGVLLWGNHFYWDAWRGCTLTFKSDETPVPVDPDTESGGYHECRPLPPAWAVLYRVDARVTSRAIRECVTRHVFDAATGGFNRHADGKKSHAFIESGGILVESAAWLHAREDAPELLDLARKIARFSFESRHPETGLMENDRTSKRWDKLVCTTEVGLWAGSLLRASEYSGDAFFAECAADAVRAWLRFGYDAKARRYYGKLKVADGSPSLGPKESAYQPGDYADFWAPLFPAHDYPFALAETCLRLHARTGEDLFAEAARNLAAQLARETPVNGGKGGYAEHYGRGIHFLAHASRHFKDAALLEQAQGLADEAIRVLLLDGMFRGHPGEDRYDAVDGVGLLLLGLMTLHAGADVEGHGFGF